MTPKQIKFLQFKTSPLGRTIDITLGVALLWLGSGLVSLLDYIFVIVGIFAFVAGFFRVCWAAPILGVPFKDKDIIKKIKESEEKKEM